MMDEINYFTCTLGQAASLPTDRPEADLKTINDFLDFQAKHCPNLPAVAFPVPGEALWGYEVLSMFPLSQSCMCP